MNSKDVPSTQLYYREARGSLVFAPPHIADRIAQIHFALEASTWGEFKARLPEGEYERLVRDSFEENDDGTPDVPNDCDPDPTDYVPGFSDGDYPDWLQGRQHRYLPAEICARFGVLEDSVLNDTYWRFEPATEHSLIAALRDLGVEVARRDDLEFW